ncbi:protein EMSY-LIKE 1-like isoform X2 [Mangifera indica]|uniref:protein EMSY-LIKE 1-like isoform X2 n=1 Tax=Mangifera indica TaxID=29780 RepID=UPI001CFAF6E4|nr:protein EMSY-LIKE 1-like isoform X2 [Mangifera indica]
MEYEVCDSSGTDDDLPPHQNRATRGSRVTVNGRSAVGSAPFSRMHTDMEKQIHQLEQEAYFAVLRAFKAQSDAITWEKEGLITELRKELRVSDDEHRELLTKVTGDDIIKRIRDWRQAGEHQPARLATSQPSHDLLPSPSVSASRKRQKMSQSGQQLHSLPMMNPIQYPSTGAAGNRSFINHSSSGAISASEPVEGANSLVGRKVWTRWPEDNNFYEAVITDYNPVEGRHALVYDIHTTNETWEWVNLKEIPHEDIRWDGTDPVVSYQGVHGGQGRAVKKPPSLVGHTAGAGRGRGSTKVSGLGPGQVQISKEFMSSQNRIEKTDSDDIELLNTETLVQEVEKIFEATHPDPLELDKAKKMLKEHEKALIEAISRLADASDGGSGNKFILFRIYASSACSFWGISV